LENHIWTGISDIVKTFAWYSHDTPCIKNDQFKKALHWLRKKYEEKDCPKKGDKADVKVNDQRWEATLVKKL